MNVFQNRREITRTNMYFIYFAFFFLQLSSIQTTETQTEQTEPLDSSLQKLSREQAPDLCLLAEVAAKIYTDEFEDQDLIVKEVGAERKRKSTEEIPGKELKRNKPQCAPWQNEVASKEDVEANTSKKLHICPTCNKTFSYPSKMIVHMRSHTGEKPYDCLTCNKSFPHSSTLNDHMRIHSGEKPYVCCICNSSFVQSSNWKTHMRTHTGEKPYVCPICGRSFSQSSSGKRHMKTHTGKS
ncbi:zinc finger protein [Loa loa]|uniref:Zinc finger protein n=1 Tax=Loa loa TaxID=7209 RepID=A0A1I7VA87_LOALO|nr:zinc finger protein [Loa loa]EFO19369.1 zinc finger protein [Loa loa]